MAISTELHEACDEADEELNASLIPDESRDECLSLLDEARLREVMAKREITYRNGFRQRAVVELALYTGAKVNELERLSCGDLFLEPGARSIRIPSESNPRVLPLTPELHKFFEEYLTKKIAAGESIARNEPLVCSQLGSRLSLRGWQAAWALAQRHAGLADDEGKALYNLEVARRVVGRRLYRIAGNPHHVQSWLGLDTVSNADRYRPENLNLTTEVLRALVDGSGGFSDLLNSATPSLNLAMGHYNGTIGVMNRTLARRMFLDNPPEDPRREMWVARGLTRGRCLFPENEEMGVRKAGAVIAQLRELAERNDPMAVYLYASATDEGLGVKRDFEKSAELYRKSMELGFETSITNLALKYHWGSGVPQDDVMAAKLFHKAAALHEVSAMFNLGVLYQEGMGVEKDMQKAIRWYTRAAIVGEPRSMNNLSYLYFNGVGVTADEMTGERWYCLAGEISYGGDGIVKKGMRLEMIRAAG